LITFCFALWGFANDITNPMVKAFSKIFRMSVTEGALVQVAFYGGYAVAAFPAAIFIRRYSYKAGILLGLGLYAVGVLMFFPAKLTGNYYPFLLAYLIMTIGLSFLETSANPFILSMGSEETSTRRLNFAQSFNPVGSVMGMFVAMNFIQARMNPMSTAERALLPAGEFEALKQSDLGVVSTPYLLLGIVILIVLAVIWLARMPRRSEGGHSINFWPTVRRIFSIANYREGVIAQFFYIGVQIMAWTFIIQYGTRIFMAEPYGMTEQAAEVLSQRYNIVAMILFICSRFVCTWLMKYVNPSRLLSIFAVVGGVLTAGVVAFRNVWGLYCLVGVSACMSLMFPTIYGIALKGLGDDAKFGAAGLIMAILGGALLPPAQAAIIDAGTVMGMPAVNVSFVLPLVCFVIILVYGIRSQRRGARAE
jgi:FHS family L-fucose permease-like MFS transporter